MCKFGGFFWCYIFPSVQYRIEDKIFAKDYGMSRNVGHEIVSIDFEKARKIV